MLVATVMGAIGIASLTYVFYANVFPVPAYPFNTLPYYFLACLVIGIVGYAILRVRHPEVAERAGTFADDSVAAD